jgi:NAD(P)H-hydrate epimerase
MSSFWLSRDEVRELDRRALEGFGVPGIVLMENAGRGCAELLMRLNPERKPVVILCGPGNNGGDGFVIARHLDNHGWPVLVHPVEPGQHFPDRHDVDVEQPKRGLPPDAMTNWQIVNKSRLCNWPQDRASCSFKTLYIPQDFSGCWIVDAMFGTGLSRSLETPYADIIERGVNVADCPVLAVDIPSGLDCDTGQPLGPTIRATHTATFVAHKKGFLNPESHQWTGEVHVIDIGAPRVLIDEYRQRRTT